jgi:hypothetical protein
VLVSPDFRAKICGKNNREKSWHLATLFPCSWINISLLSQNFFPVSFPGRDGWIADKPLNLLGFRPGWGVDVGAR